MGSDCLCLNSFSSNRSQSRVRRDAPSTFSAGRQRRKSLFTAIHVASTAILPLINVTFDQYWYGHHNHCHHRCFCQVGGPGITRNPQSEITLHVKAGDCFGTSQTSWLPKHVFASALSHHSCTFLSVRVTHRDIHNGSCEWLLCHSAVPISPAGI